ncbi:MAG: BlaI/MecI/CopY family transcriptional regulator [Planctomycetota bacterium]|jgi:predicted transcriptional regulator
MARRKLPRLSEAQLELMSIIWRKDEATVTEVWESLPRGRHIARTTVMTVLARLADKGWLRRRKSGNEYIYSPAVGRDKALGGMLSRLVDTAFAGSAEGLVMTLVNARGISKEEAERLRRIIDASAGRKR